MSVSLYRRIETLTGPRETTATICYSLSGKSARIEIRRIGSLGIERRLDTRRCSPARAKDRARELLKFWTAVQPGDSQ